MDSDEQVVDGDRGLKNFKGALRGQQVFMGERRQKERWITR
jgi:hypothetical protein